MFAKTSNNKTLVMFLWVIDAEFSFLVAETGASFGGKDESCFFKSLNWEKKTT